MKTQMILKKLFILLIVIIVTVPAALQAQVSFQFMPALNGQSVNGLFMVQLHNAGLLNYNGKVKITVKDGNNKIVLVALTPSIFVRQGGNMISALVSQSRIQFGSSTSANIISQTGRFPEDEYEYCFEFTGTENKTNADEQVFENCFTYIIQPLIPLSLIYPGDGDEICNTRPEFTWQPAMPLNSNLRYRLLVTEKRNKQNAADALMNNVPVFQQDNIAGFMLMYPPQVPELQKDKQYTWQVVAYEGNTKVTQSEIWQFSIKCDDRKLDSSKESYRELSGSLNGNFYMAAGILRFSITNPYSTEKMEYGITDLSDPVKIIKNLPDVKVQTGLNKIDIALEDVKGLEIDKMYLLKIKNIGSQPLYLRFIYKGDVLQ
jgi:hypothetical protein